MADSITTSRRVAIDPDLSNCHDKIEAIPILVFNIIYFHYPNDMIGSCIDLMYCVGVSRWYGS